MGSREHCEGQQQELGLHSALIDTYTPPAEQSRGRANTFSARTCVPDSERPRGWTAKAA